MRCVVKLYMLVALFVLWSLSSTGLADPTSDVARLSYVNGSVGLLPAGEQEWVQPSINRPLVLGDVLWDGDNTKVELEFGMAKAWLNSSTSFKILNLSSSIRQFQLAQGTLVLSITQLQPKQVYEINTPNIALSISQPGLYRIDVTYDGDKSMTTVRANSGSGEAYGKNSSSGFQIKQGNVCSFTGVDLANPQCNQVLSMDAFDKWIQDRVNRTVKTATTNSKVSTSVLGYEDLDNYGTWENVGDYGDVWMPEDVGPDWAPYSDGNWLWLNDWGWTWVDYQPWGFAPFHYGRWIFAHKRWGWVPGPHNVNAIYAPALVGFINRGNSIGWFPLAPGEVFRPAYAVSRDYFRNLNFSNSVFANKNIDSWYNKTNAKFNYKNMNVKNAITAVTQNSFNQAQRTSGSHIKVNGSAIKNANINSFAPIAPTAKSVLGASAKQGFKPSAHANTPAVIRTQPPKQAQSFANVQNQLNKNPGKPLDASQIQEPAQPLKAIPIPLPLNLPTKGQNPGFENIKPLKPAAGQAPIKKQTPATHLKQKQKAPTINQTPGNRPTLNQRPANRPTLNQRPTPTHHKAPAYRPTPVHHKAPAYHSAPVHHQAPAYRPAPSQRPAAAPAARPGQRHR